MIESALAFSMRSRFGYSLTMDTRFCFVYQLSQSKLIDKSILQRKLAELYDIAEEEVKNSQQD